MTNVVPELARNAYFSEGTVSDDVFDPDILVNGFESGCLMHRHRLKEPCEQAFWIVFLTRQGPSESNIKPRRMTSVDLPEPCAILSIRAARGLVDVCAQPCNSKAHFV